MNELMSALWRIFNFTAPCKTYICCTCSLWMYCIMLTTSICPNVSKLRAASLWGQPDLYNRFPTPPPSRRLIPRLLKTSVKLEIWTDIERLSKYLQWHLLLRHFLSIVSRWLYKDICFQSIVSQFCFNKGIVFGLLIVCQSPKITISN